MRSTYPACRAVIAAKNQADKFELPMINIIQKAYYLQEKNPSKDETLIKLSISIGLAAIYQGFKFRRHANKTR
jgi:putative protein-disulfide isomerase